MMNATRGILFCTLIAAATALNLLQITATAPAETATFVGVKMSMDKYAAVGNVVFHFESNATGVFVVTLRSDDNGVFNRVGANLIEASGLLKTNGNWHGVFSVPFLYLWQLDSNNNAVNTTTLNVPASTFELLADDTIVTQEEEYYNGDYIIKTYISLGNGTWQDVEQQIYLGMAVTQSMHADVNNLVTLNTSGIVALYTRSGNGWEFSDTFNTSVGETEDALVYYNGVDTVCVLYLRSPEAQAGLVEFYTKVAGTWSRRGAFTPVELGLVNPNWRNAIFVNKDNFVVAGPYDGTVDKKRVASQPFGSAVLFQRSEDDTWAATARFSSPDLVYFAPHVLPNDKFFVFPGYTDTFFGDVQLYTVPLCLISPADVTCNRQELDTCEFDLNDAQLAAYTINSPASCGTVTPSVASITFSDYVFNISMSFEKPLARPFTCNAALSCPAPVIPSAPVSIPVVNAPDKKTSAASVTSFVGASLAVALVALF